jgi:hypothetical protein
MIVELCTLDCSTYYLFPDQSQVELWYKEIQLASTRVETVKKRKAGAEEIAVTRRLALLPKERLVLVTVREFRGILPSAATATSGGVVYDRSNTTVISSTTSVFHTTTASASASADGSTATAGAHRAGAGNSDASPPDVAPAAAVATMAASTTSQEPSSGGATSSSSSSGLIAGAQISSRNGGGSGYDSGSDTDGYDDCTAGAGAAAGAGAGAGVGGASAGASDEFVLVEAERVLSQLDDVSLLHDDETTSMTTGAAGISSGTTRGCEHSTHTNNASAADNATAAATAATSDCALAQHIAVMEIEQGQPSTSSGTTASSSRTVNAEERRKPTSTFASTSGTTSNAVKVVARTAANKTRNAVVKLKDVLKSAAIRSVEVEVVPVTHEGSTYNLALIRYATPFSFKSSKSLIVMVLTLLNIF